MPGCAVLREFQKLGGIELSHRKDTDYLSISSRLRVLENRLLSKERMERMIEAKDLGEAVKVLAECGYGEPAALNNASIEQMLGRARQKVFQDLSNAAPEPQMLQIFQVKYDYHNAKVLLKAKPMGEEPGRLLLEGGRYSVEQITEWFEQEDLQNATKVFAGAVAEAQTVLAETGDPQQADLILDRAYYEEMGQLAKETGSQYMQGYVSLMVDIANLRAAVRTARMGKENEFLAKVLLDGGSISAKSLLSAKNGAVAELCKSGALRQVGELANQAASGSASLTAFEKACDDALMAYIATARKIPFGEEVLIGYLCAREAELTAARTILSGRLAGLDGDTIRARLRATYV